MWSLNYCFIFQVGSWSVSQAGLELTMELRLLELMVILLSWLPMCWYYKCEPNHLDRVLPCEWLHPGIDVIVSTYLSILKIAWGKFLTRTIKLWYPGIDFGKMYFVFWSLGITLTCVGLLLSLANVLRTRFKVVTIYS